VLGASAESRRPLSTQHPAPTPSLASLREQLVELVARERCFTSDRSSGRMVVARAALLSMSASIFSSIVLREMT
jgi:hypothetical protein